MSKRTLGPWVTQGEVAAAREWLATDHRTGTRAKQAIEGMMYTAGRYPASQLIERADYLARKTVRLAGGPTGPTALTEIDAAIDYAHVCHRAEEV